MRIAPPSHGGSGGREEAFPGHKEFADLEIIAQWAIERVERAGRAIEPGSQLRNAHGSRQIGQRIGKRAAGALRQGIAGEILARQPMAWLATRIGRWMHPAG